MEPTATYADGLKVWTHEGRGGEGRGGGGITHLGGFTGLATPRIGAVSACGERAAVEGGGDIFPATPPWLGGDFFLLSACAARWGDGFCGRGLGGAGLTGLMSLFPSESDPDEILTSMESSWSPSSRESSRLSSREMIVPTRGCEKRGVVSLISTSTSSGGQNNYA